MPASLAHRPRGSHPDRNLARRRLFDLLDYVEPRVGPYLQADPVARTAELVRQHRGAGQERDDAAQPDAGPRTVALTEPTDEQRADRRRSHEDQYPQRHDPPAVGGVDAELDPLVAGLREEDHDETGRQQQDRGHQE